MILFLTSSPTGDLDGSYSCDGLDTRNGFVDNLREVWPEDARVLMITASPDDDEANEEMYDYFYEAILKTGLSCSEMELWDSHVFEGEGIYSKENLHSYDVIILGGGHVPTENDFFHGLNLRENIKGFEGIVIGISAGTMNCADVVYAQPEEPGEAVDPNYQRFITGLGLTDVNVLPHYQIVCDNYLDGLHLYDDIALPDSFGRQFLALPDGSYVVEFEDETIIFGHAILVEDGQMTVINRDGEILNV
ncbi:MAG: Type 1 glutamine amidotransferase-like domain-containing protein [Eubacterium sp.]|nr:Type 1 glutamine amidotransferase-like domain-containing protein [Candidatus Colimonas fimequi]